VRDEEILHRLREVLLRDYWPHPVFEFNGYSSMGVMALGTMLPAPMTGEMETLRLQDGGTVLLHWSERSPGPAAPLVLILPGLGNDSRTAYIQSAVGHLGRQGFAAVVLNYRAVGPQELRTPRVGCADSWRDLPEVLAHVRARAPEAPLAAVGYSMGASILLKYLGVAGAGCPLAGAMAVSAPVDIPSTAADIHSPKNWAVSFAMAQGVKIKALPKLLASPFAKFCDLRKAFLASTLGQIEDAVICQLHGYRDVPEYYSKNNARTGLGNISVPTLILSAMDDIVSSPRLFPMEEMRANPRIYTVLTRRGGHIGWCSGGLRGSGSAGSWADNIASLFLSACVGSSSSSASSSPSSSCSSSPSSGRAGLAPGRAKL